MIPTFIRRPLGQQVLALAAAATLATCSGLAQQPTSPQAPAEKPAKEVPVVQGVQESAPLEALSFDTM